MIELIAIGILSFLAGGFIGLKYQMGKQGDVRAKLFEAKVQIAKLKAASRDNWTTAECALNCISLLLSRINQSGANETGANIMTGDIEKDLGKLRKALK